MRNQVAWGGAGVVLMALALAGAGGSGSVPVIVGGGAPLAVVLGCVACLGAGLYAVTSGMWGYLLWSPKAFSASLACIGVCAAVLTT